MGKGVTMLTTEEITEMLMHHDELLEMYRMQINELTKEYDAENDLIEMTQLHSPQYGIVGKSSNQMNLDQVYQKVEKQRKEYQEAICSELQRVLELYNQVQQIHLCYLHLPQKQKSVLRELYINRKFYKEIERPGLSERTIHRLRKQGLETIKARYESNRFDSTTAQKAK